MLPLISTRSFYSAADYSCFTAAVFVNRFKR